MPAEAAQGAWQALVPHPRTPCGALHAVHAALSRADARRWRACFRFQGRIAALRVPPPEPARRADGLWRHLCGEVFAMAADGSYAEFNFAPSGCWAAYQFDGYRSGMRDAAFTEEPVVTCRHDEHSLELQALLALPPAVSASEAPRVALCAMVEEADGRLSCWAVSHGDEPDFHRAGGFVALPR